MNSGGSGFGPPGDPYGAPPPYGGQPNPYGAPPYGAPPYGAAPPGLSRHVRPHRWWYLLAVLFLGGGIAVGVGIFAATLAGGTPEQTFAANQIVTVHLRKDPQPGFYVTDAGSMDDNCFAVGQDGRRIAAARISGTMTFTVNGMTWHVVSRVRLPADGTYRVFCRPASLGANPRYGIGTPPHVGDFVLGVMIPVAGILLASTTTIVVAVRRRSHRRRLLATAFR